MLTRALSIVIACVACSAPATQGPAPTTSGPGPERAPPANPTRAVDETASCPSIQIIAPDAVSAGTRARVTANIVDGPSSTTYRWSVSAGKLATGQGTSSVFVDTSGLAGASVTATIELGGLPKKCATTTASASFLIGP